MSWEKSWDEGEGGSQIKKYMRFSQRIIDKIKNLTLSPKFEPNVCFIRNEASMLIQLLFTTRYYLRYLEKQIENKEVGKKKMKGVDKWK